MIFWIELGMVLVAVALAFTFPGLGSRWFAAVECVLGRLAEKRRLAVVVVGLTALALRAALLPIPQPGVHDEFGYLLLADTFAHGRLANPTHPMWVHFESFHINWQPTYTAMFYPAQGLMMALGQVVLGHPFWGVWLSVGLMCAAICWMLQGWLPPGWALLGGMLAVIRLGTFSYWANSYWGGAVAALGGALVLGALPRMKRSQRVRDALLMGLGFAILANSRPYEGLFFGLPMAGALAVWMVGKNRPPLRLAVRRVVAPLMLVLALTGLAMGYYFWRTTGSPWDTPYLVNQRTYNPVPYFPWQSLKPTPVYRHRVFRDFYLGEAVADYQRARSLAGLVNGKANILMTLGLFYLGPVLTLPLLMALATVPYGFSWKDTSPDTRLLLGVCGAVIAGSMLPIWFLPHYAAPMAGAILALVLQAMRRIGSQPGRGKPWGLFITRAVPLICVLLLVLRASAKPLHLPEPDGPIWCKLTPTNLERAAALAELQHYPGGQLAIVRYGPHHDIPFHEWVYNKADIDRAKVVWARDMGREQNAELLRYFQARRIWLVEPDLSPPRLSAYPPD